MSGSDGQYVIPLLPVALYSINVEMAGFERFEQRGIEVRTDQNSAVTVTLITGASTQLVTVEANAQMVETRSGALSQLIAERNISSAPGRLAQVPESVVPRAACDVAAR
jgi:hypothetical protein